jgi:hypothetical protein
MSGCGATLREAPPGHRPVTYVNQSSRPSGESRGEDLGLPNGGIAVWAVRLQLEGMCRQIPLVNRLAPPFVTVRETTTGLPSVIEC